MYGIKEFDDWGNDLVTCMVKVEKMGFDFGVVIIVSGPIEVNVLVADLILKDEGFYNHFLLRYLFLDCGYGKIISSRLFQIH